MFYLVPLACISRHLEIRLRGLIRCKLNVFRQENLFGGIRYFMLHRTGGHVRSGCLIISEAKFDHLIGEVTAGLPTHFA